jgi:dTDP-4-dehydrorhamnose reductase
MDRKYSNCIPEIWGGLECSFNRVGDLFMDQLHYSGHYQRAEEDIARFATLGITAMRYPVIWERHQYSPHAAIDWSWSERQLNALNAHRIKPVVGLLHHGNGPAFTTLLSPAFPELFASYAGSVAEKFPWLEWYTPINEPLTTARFSGLYGLWYPHRKTGNAFATILFNQMKAIVLAMAEIRKINPDARLLQTEDLSKTYSTSLLQYQADFENERRWLTYDILCGLLNKAHPLWDYLKWLKVSDKLLHFFIDNPCPPDLIGADHYLTSERFLDQKFNMYPAHARGGNHRHRYADVEAIRVNHPEPAGLKVLLKECWDRYAIPIAVTEVHVNGHSDDQIRWFREVWDICITLNQEGLSIPAVTSWALLGSYGWNNLLTAPHGHYEHGAFDLRSGKPEPTPLASFLKALSENPEHSHPALEHKGWWQDESRWLYNVKARCKTKLSATEPSLEDPSFMAP